MPALLKAMSILPNVFTVCSIAALTSASLATSPRMNVPLPPALLTRSTVCLPSSTRRPVITTLAPRLANATAVARPMPLVPPVMNTVLFLNSDMGVPFQKRELEPQMNTDGSEDEPRANGLLADSMEFSCICVNPGSSVVQDLLWFELTVFARLDNYLDPLIAANDFNRHALAEAVVGEQSLEVINSLHRVAGESDDHIPFTDLRRGGGAVGLDADHQHAAIA